MAAYLGLLNLESTKEGKEVKQILSNNLFLLLVEHYNQLIHYIENALLFIATDGDTASSTSTDNSSVTSENIGSNNVAKSGGPGV